MNSQVEISKRLVLINSTSAVLQRILSLGVLFWLQQHLIRKLDQPELALYYVVFALMMFVPLISMVLTSGLARFVIERRAQGDERGVVQVTSTAAPICLLISVIMLLIGFLVAINVQHLNIADDLVRDARIMLAILVGNAALSTATMPFTVGLTVCQKFVWLHLIGLGAQILYTVTLLALMLGVSTRALWVPVAMIPQMLFGLTVTIIVSRRLVPSLRFELSEFQRDLVRPLVSFGGWTMVARVMAVGREVSGTLALNMLPAARPEVARNTNASAFRQGALPESRIFPTILLPLTTTLPALTAMHAMGQIDRMRRTYYRLTRYVLWAYLFVALPLMVYHYEFWQLYTGNKYPAAGVVMTLLLCKAIAVFPQPVMAQVVAARARVRPMALRAIVIELTSIIAVVYAVAVHEVAAVGVAAVSLGVCLALHPLLMWTHALHLVDATFARWSRATLLPGVIPGLVALPVWLLLRHVANPESWIALGAQAAAGCVVFVAVLVIFCLEDSERADMAKILDRVRAFLPRRRPT